MHARAFRRSSRDLCFLAWHSDEAALIAATAGARSSSSMNDSESFAGASNAGSSMAFAGEFIPKRLTFLPPLGVVSGNGVDARHTHGFVKQSADSDGFLPMASARRRICSPLLVVTCSSRVHHIENAALAFQLRKGQQKKSACL